MSTIKLTGNRRLDTPDQSVPHNITHDYPRRTRSGTALGSGVRVRLLALEAETEDASR